MPMIMVEGPPVSSVDVKRRLVEGLTEVAAEVYEMDRAIIHVVVRENPPENVGSGGRLIADIHAARGRDGG